MQSTAPKGQCFLEYDKGNPFFCASQFRSLTLARLKLMRSTF